MNKYINCIVIILTEMLLGEYHKAQNIVDDARKAHLRFSFIHLFKKNKNNKKYKRENSKCGESAPTLPSANMVTTVQIDSSSLRLKRGLQDN